MDVQTGEEMKPELLINLAGTGLGIIGAVLNALGDGIAFPVWMISNVLLFILFLGVWRGWWKLNSGAMLQCGLYIIYMGTSTIGMMRVYG